MTASVKIDYIELPAVDLGAAETFYKKVFAWTFQDYGPEYRAFSDGSIDGGFYRAELCSKADSGSALIIFHTDNLEEMQKSIENAGGTIVKPVFSFPGGKRFHFADPAGNELAVWSKES